MAGGLTLEQMYVAQMHADRMRQGASRDADDAARKRRLNQALHATAVLRSASLARRAR